MGNVSVGLDAVAVQGKPDGGQPGQGPRVPGIEGHHARGQVSLEIVPPPFQVGDRVGTVIFEIGVVMQPIVDSCLCGKRDARVARRIPRLLGNRPVLHALDDAFLAFVRISVSVQHAFQRIFVVRQQVEECIVLRILLPLEVVQRPLVFRPLRPSPDLLQGHPARVWLRPEKQSRSLGPDPRNIGGTRLKPDAHNDNGQQYAIHASHVSPPSFVQFFPVVSSLLLQSPVHPYRPSGSPRAARTCAPSPHGHVARPDCLAAWSPSCRAGPNPLPGRRWTGPRSRQLREESRPMCRIGAQLGV